MSYVSFDLSRPAGVEQNFCVQVEHIRSGSGRRDGSEVGVFRGWRRGMMIFFLKSTSFS